MSCLDKLSVSKRPNYLNSLFKIPRDDQVTFHTMFKCLVEKYEQDATQQFKR